MPHKKLSELKPFKSWQDAAESLQRELDELIIERADIVAFALRMARFDSRLRLTAEEERRKKRR